jgi:hypothetical protein
MLFAGFLGIKFDKGKQGDPSNIMCRLAECNMLGFLASNLIKVSGVIHPTSCEEC